MSDGVFSNDFNISANIASILAVGIIECTNNLCLWNAELTYFN